MAFQGTCTWILFCSGPTARVMHAGSGDYVAGFGLQNGTGQGQSFDTGAGTYEIQVTPAATRRAGRFRSRTCTNRAALRLDAVTPSRREWARTPNRLWEGAP